MAGLRAYVLSVIAASVICALTMKLSGKQNSTSAIMRFVCGLVMSAVIVQPIGEMMIPNLRGYFQDLELQVHAVVERGTELSYQTFAQGIQEQSQAYIQNKATELGATLHVTVELDDSNLPVPERAILSGMIAPAAKIELENFIETELGIGKENQIWK